MSAQIQPELMMDHEANAVKFSLRDHRGYLADERRFRGQFSLVFFGFTHCAVVCPRALERFEQLLPALGPRAQHVNVLYITVDPDRDTPHVMAQFLTTRFPSVLGLTGTPQQLQQARATFKVFASRRSAGQDDYVVPHTAFTYVLGPQGQMVDHWSEHHPQAARCDRLIALIDAAAARDELRRVACAHPEPPPPC